MKKTIQSKNYRWILVVISLIIVSCICSSCANNKSDEQIFNERLEGIEKVDSKVLVELKEICTKALEETGIEIEQLFISSAKNNCYVHVLTIEGEYMVYSIKSPSYLAVMCMSLQSGGSVYDKDILEYLAMSKPIVSEEFIDLG